ncbi:hypothetical protein LOTGIDRAFT_233994 [Lottia gigantea]|uniref:ZP domain-containing protein n=1 Tax=Lottia gigantea TaxID=225164 RepID=V4A997_LOTGI|nr:hypothetical protein LOTGIDRAFT_233994 [Lottia gigantea]ESO89841.1 hypothetical protein LOTGIDRAFT_233994 [Lottia gigantea]
MKFDLFIIAFQLACCVGRILAGRFEVVCGNPPNNPATIYYYGDVAAVFAYRFEDITNCMFQSASHGIFSREIPFNLTDPCGFIKTCETRNVYVIYLETRSLHPLIESVSDEEIMVVCNFMAYGDTEAVFEVV